MPTKSQEESISSMQLTRSGHSRWRPSLLILVFYGRPNRAGAVACDLR